uniref:Glycosyltransferase n=1 Tax=Polygala tenuifolia TaxID=355332 RepID=A0A3G3NBZ3_9FABA|nr:UDP-glucosyltransferase UGT85A55 [Polygala tenuifolia]
MDYLNSLEKPHAVFIPYPAQGHINPMLKLAKLFHFRGFHITFVNTEYNHKRLLKARGSNSLDGLPDFCFETIPDGLPPSDADATQDIPTLTFSIRDTFFFPFLRLLTKLNESASAGFLPKVSCIVSDSTTTWISVKAADQLGIPTVSFWTVSASTFNCFAHIPHLIDRGLIPLKDKSCLTNGYLDKKLEWIPCLKNVRLRDLPSFFNSTEPNDLDSKITDFVREAMVMTTKATAVIINTFSELEQDVVSSLSTMFPKLYTIGPVHLLADQVIKKHLESIGSNLWKEEAECMQWLDTKQPNSVVYVNYGSITVMTPDQLTEFAWGLANSKKPFLWIIRPDLVNGSSDILSSEFENEIKERGLITGWCPQEQVLSHPSIGGFLTHCGWNSTIESMTQGVPLVCWPFYGDQQTNCRFACTEWGIGIEIDTNVKRGEVETLVNELMEGDKGKAVKANVMEWKKKAEQAVRPDGSSSMNLDKLIEEVLLKARHDSEFMIHPPEL